MIRKILFTFILAVFLWEISFGFSFGNMFNPFHWAEKAFKAVKLVSEEMWKFKPSDIGKTLNPFEFGRDVMTRGIVLGMKLRRAMMDDDFGVMDTMSLYGYKMYKTGANLMPGDYEDRVLAEMVKVMLSDKEITKEFIKEALKYDGLAEMMLRIASKDPSIIDMLVSMMSVDNSVSELLIKLAIKDADIGKLLFRKMDNTTFRVLIDSMFESKSVTKQSTKLFNKLSNYVFSNNSKFKNFFFLPENSIYVEKMMYAVFKNKDAIDNFEQFFSKIPEEWQFKMMNYIMNGITPDGGEYPDEPYYFMHAVIKGMAKGNTIDYLIEKDMSKYQHLKPFMDKFMLTLVTGAELYEEEEHKEVLNKLSQIKSSSNDEEKIKPDPNIPPPRIEKQNKDIKNYFKIKKEDFSVDLSIDFKIKFFGFDFKGQKIYSKGDNDKWLLLPYWLSPATWIALSNKKEDRELPNRNSIGKIVFNNDKEFLVFIVASQYAPCVVWALKEGFIPIYGEFIESEKQTGFVLLGKVFDKNQRILELFGNGGGSYGYTVGIMEENEHPMYQFAKNKILRSSIDYIVDFSDGIEFINFYPQEVKTIRPNNTKINHRVHRTAIPMFNEISMKWKAGFVMFDKNNGSIYIYGDDRFQLENHKLPETEKQIFSIAYGGGVFVALGEDKRVYISDDGVNWSSIKTGKVLYDIAYGNGKFVAVGENGNVMLIDPWNMEVKKVDRKNSGTKGKDLIDVEYINGRFYVAGEDGIIAVSETVEDKKEAWRIYKIDIKSLLGLEKDIDFSITKITHFDKYYALTDNGIVLHSQNLTDWKIGVQLDSMTPLIDIAYNPMRDIILAAGLNGVIVTSKDGVKWDDAKLLDCESFVDVVYTEKGFLLLAKNGKIVQFYPYFDDLKKSEVTDEIKENVNTKKIVSSSAGGGCSFNGGSKDIPVVLLAVVSLLLLRRKMRIS